MIFEKFATIFQEIGVGFLAPLYEIGFVQGSRWFFAYLAFSILFALLVLAWKFHDRRLGPLANFKALFARLADRDVFLHDSARLDYRFAVVNHLFTVSILAYLFVWVNVASTYFHAFFSHALPVEGAGLTLGWFGSALIVFLYAFAYDTTNFFQHWLQHRIPILWEFHKVHHSAEVLTPVTAVRNHPVGQLLTATIGGIVYGSLNGLSFSLFSGQNAEYAIFGANFFALIYFTVGLYHLKHSHVWFTYPRFVREIIQSPSLHLIHHSNNPVHYDKNFGFVFTFWDRIFGTYYDPHEDEQHGLYLGISESEGQSEYTTVWQLYSTPFRRAWKYHLKPLLARDSNSSLDPAE
ncbi:MAG: sterol desaturase family protein [Rhizobiaceae bacterium]